MSFLNAKVIGKDVDSTEYHKQTSARGTPGFFMSPSQLKEFRHCPERWKDGYERPESKALQDGNVFDCLLLTPDQFRKRYAVKPETYYNEKEGEEKPWNSNATACKEWADDHSDIPKDNHISTTKHKEVLAAVARFKKNDKLASFHAASDVQVLVQAEWHDKATELVIPVRCLIDLVPRLDTEWAKCIGDMKRTRNAGLSAFGRDCHKLGYHIQAAFDLDMYVLATAEDRNTWCLLVQENIAPWQPARRMLSQAFMDIGRRDYKAALELYCQCMKRDYWPDYDATDEAIQGWSLVEPAPWMESEGQFAPRMEMPPEEGGDAPEDEFVSQEPT